MGLFDSESKQKKQNQIELQNIVLNINERKLQVSEDFLDQMTKIYISKYMKIVNDNVSELSNASNIGSLFRKYDNAMTNLDNLIMIEPYYRFKKPTPTQYKEQVKENLPAFINSLIAREWKKIKAMSNGSLDDPNIQHKLESFFEVFFGYEDKLPKSSVDMLNRLRSSVFPLNSTTPPESSDGFVPETFERIKSDNE